MDKLFSGGYVYCLTIMSAKYDYKCYIGQHHTSEYGIVDDYWGSGAQWQKVREECDKQNIVITKDILCFCDSKAEMDRMEKFWIAQLDTTNPEYGYNICLGGGGTVGLSGEKSFWYGKHRSAETRRKLSEAKKNPSAETKRKLSDAKSGEKNPIFGKHHSAETIKKMSDANKGEKNHNFGKHLSAETRRKMSDAHTNFEIIVYKDNIEVARLRGHADIDNYFGKKNANSNVYACCRGKHKSYKGYTFRKELL